MRKGRDWKCHHASERASWSGPMDSWGPDVWQKVAVENKETGPRSHHGQYHSHRSSLCCQSRCDAARGDAVRSCSLWTREQQGRAAACGQHRGYELLLLCSRCRKRWPDKIQGRGIEWSYCIEKTRDSSASKRRLWCHCFVLLFVMPLQNVRRYEMRKCTRLVVNQRRCADGDLAVRRDPMVWAAG